jgi:hypothetical protein
MANATASYLAHCLADLPPMRSHEIIVPEANRLHPRH